MLIWSEKMYLDDRLAGQKKRCQRLLEKKRGFRAFYCITLPVNGENTMEIYSSRELWFRWYRQREMTVIGLAADRECAQRLAAQICLDTVVREGTISPVLVRRYFETGQV